MRKQPAASCHGIAPRLVTAVFCLLVLAATALAQQSAGTGGRIDLNNGAVLAKRWCSSCHLVSRNQTKAIEGVPAFAELARRSELAGERLVMFLLGPHMGPMAPSGLSREDARDLAAYIAAQR
jgi:mono/diheme cytochrome c family protein